MDKETEAKLAQLDADLQDLENTLTWQERLVRERDQLQRRFEKLNAWFGSDAGKAAMAADPEGHELSAQQLDAMEQYLQSLSARVGRI